MAIIEGNVQPIQILGQATDKFINNKSYDFATVYKQGTTNIELYRDNIQEISLTDSFKNPLVKFVKIAVAAKTLNSTTTATNIKIFYRKTKSGQEFSINVPLII